MTDGWKDTDRWMKRQTNRWIKKKTVRLTTGQINRHRLVDKDGEMDGETDNGGWRETEKWRE